MTVDETWQDLLDEWSRWLRAGGALATTIRLRRQHVTQLARMYPDGVPTTTGELVAFMAAYDWSPSARYAARSSLRVFYSWLVQDDYLKANPAEKLPKVTRRPANPHPLGDDELDQALARADERARLILMLAARCGLRRGEIARVQHRDVVGSRGAFSLVVHGKGERERTIPIADDLAEAVLARGPGWTFPGNDAGHLSPDWVGRMIGDLLPPGWTIHSARHRFASVAYAAERDLFAVQKLLGHATPTTTQIYVRVPDDRLRAAMLAASAPRTAA